jgi:hypothetical protein
MGSCDLLAPLFDAQRVRITNSQLMLQGYQIHADSGTGVASIFAMLGSAICAGC